MGGFNLCEVYAFRKGSLMGGICLWEVSAYGRCLSAVCMSIGSTVSTSLRDFSGLFLTFLKCFDVVMSAHSNLTSKLCLHLLFHLLYL